MHPLWRSLSNHMHPGSEIHYLNHPQDYPPKALGSSQTFPPQVLWTMSQEYFGCKGLEMLFLEINLSIWILCKEIFSLTQRLFYEHHNLQCHPIRTWHKNTQFLLPHQFSVSHNLQFSPFYESMKMRELIKLHELWKLVLNVEIEKKYCSFHFHFF